MEKEKIVFKGSHPDSLYRVPSERGSSTRKIVQMLRLLRWPVALFGVCVALAIFVYFLMPDNLGHEFDKINATNWEENFSSAQSYSTAPSTSGPFNRNISKSSATGTTISEIDFNEADTNTNVSSVIAESSTTRKLPIPPTFPTHIEPEVQYGNEDDNLRKPKLLFNTKTTPDESTFRPHITHHPEKPLAIYFKDAEASSTSTTPKITTAVIKKAETFNTLPKLEEKATTKPQPQAIDIQSPAELSKINEARIQNTYISNTRVTPDIQEYYRRPEYESNVKFTSGHSKLFGISIEDSEKIKSTTQSSLYNTRVSPTLPAWKDRVDSTTKNPFNTLSDVPQCRSTRLSLCRGILPYDLAGLPARIGKKDVTLLLPQIEYLVATNCSDRARHFACSLLEPECSPPPFSSKLPCYSLCKAIADSCEGYIPTELLPIFNCNQYSSSNCANARSPCYDRELTCGDGTCVPRDWICDGTRDCPGGEDEAPCSTCEENEFRCQSGLCIVKRWVCDGYSDCPDGDDEVDVSCRSHSNGEVQEPGEELAGSAPAPSIRKPHRLPQSRQYNPSGESDSKELLMTSDTTNALRRNFTRRPSTSRLTPYSRPMLRARKEPESTTMENITEKPAASYRKNFRKQTQRVSEIKKDLSEDMDQFYVDVIKEDELAEIPPVATKLGKSMDNLERVIDGAGLLRKAALARKQELPHEMNATEEDIGYNSAHASPCPNEELRCVDGRCITLAQLCDGTIDCSDHADEDNCYT